MDAESLARVVPPYICCQLIHWFVTFAVLTSVAQPSRF